MYLGNLFMFCGNHTANPIISSEVWSPSRAGKNSGPEDPRVSNSSWNFIQFTIFYTNNTILLYYILYYNYSIQLDLHSLFL